LAAISSSLRILRITGLSGNKLIVLVPLLEALTHHSDLNEWYQCAQSVLAPNERLYLRYMLQVGVRKEEGIKSFNLIISLGSKLCSEYYNEETGFLEHFRYPKMFLRTTKNLYVSAVPKEMLEEIWHSGRVSYSMIRKGLQRKCLKLRVKELRSFYATNMRELGLLSEQIDLMQGRIGNTVFMQHYFKQNPKVLSDKIIGLLPKLEESLLNLINSPNLS
jgi:intergrase/recombinase